MTERCGSGYCDNCMQACNPEGRTDDDEDGAPCNGGAVKVCPRCASTSVETTTVGYYGLDMNRATCRGPGCAWVGRAHEMATTEAGAEAALRELLAAMDTLATTKTAVWFGKAGTDDVCDANERLGAAVARARAVLT